MAFIRASSPHQHTGGTTKKVMLHVLLGCMPGLMALTLFFGIGSIINVLLACLFCVGFEALALRMRKRNIRFYLNDFSAVVTAILLALAIPPFAPWWLIAVGSFFAIAIAKQLYGGLGYNPFNPAMIAYVVLLISFPIEMTQWVNPVGLEGNDVSAIDAFKQIFVGVPLSQIDGLTGATPLDLMKQNNGLMLDDLYLAESIFSQGKWAGAGWEWVNIAFLAGGIYLLYKKIFTWHAPVGMLASLFVLSMLFYDGGSSNSAGSPIFHLLSGGTMLGAFFIVTDPVSSATSNRGRLIYGICIGTLIFVIRVWGNYPDAVAFAVLLMNFAAPFIDYYTIPRSYGHDKKRANK